MKNSAAQDLGHDIWLLNAPDGAEEFLVGRQRFLNELWLPCPLSELSQDQILIINRYREGVIFQEQQYSFAKRSRETLAAVASALSARSVIEIGCGKFPIEVESEYLGIDIDPEAIRSLADRGIAACHPDDLETTLKSAVDLVLSSYAMHFAISDSSIANLNRLTTNDAIFCFNLIVDDAVAPLVLMARLSSGWPFCTVVKTPKMARREFFLVLAKENGWSKISCASSAIQSI